MVDTYTPPRLMWRDRVLTIRVPRCWRWAFTVYVRFGVQFLLGVLVWRDEDRDLWINVGLGPVDVQVLPIRMWTRRERRRALREKQAEFVSEVETYLGAER